MFGIFCWRRENSVRTILSKISHISWFHECNLGYRVGLHAGYKLAVRGMQRLSAPPARKQPITLQILQEMRRRCNFSITHDRVLWGAAFMGYYFLLRRSEYLAEGKHKAKKYIIRGEDIRFENRFGHQVYNLADIEAVMVTFTGSKTDQFGNRTSRTLFRSGSSCACPVLAARSLMENCSRLNIPLSDPLCSVKPGAILSAKDMAVAIKQSATQLGYNPDQYGTHSMRSGGATALFSSGVDRLVIKLFGRWSSDTYEIYTRMSSHQVRAWQAK